jgi:hypothetical protein
LGAALCGGGDFEDGGEFGEEVCDGVEAGGIGRGDCCGDAGNGVGGLAVEKWALG